MSDGRFVCHSYEVNRRVNAGSVLRENFVAHSTPRIGFSSRTVEPRRRLIRSFLCHDSTVSVSAGNDVMKEERGGEDNLDPGGKRSRGRQKSSFRAH